MARAKPCPICGKPAIADQSPFCSQGCRDRDLMQWLSEGYAIPAATPPEEAESDSLDERLDSDEARD